MNILYPVPAGQNDYNPIVRSLNAVAETLDTVISPGFVNQILNVGNSINPTDMLLIAYKNGVELFTQMESNGVITLSPANTSIPFAFTNMQFVAKGGSDLNPGNNLSQPKSSIPSALSAVTAGGAVWVLDAGTYSDPFTLPANVTLYAPEATLAYSASSGSFITQADTGVRYVSGIVVGALEVSGGANAIIQNGALSGLLLDVIAWNSGPATFNGASSINANLLTNSVLTFTSTGTAFVRVSESGTSTIVETVPGSIKGIFGQNYYGTQTFLNQIISQQKESQETIGRTIAPTDSNTTVQYMNTTTGTYVLPNAGIPVGTVITFMQLSSGLIQFNSDGTSTILSYLNTTPVQTNGLNCVAYAEQISAGVWMISGNIQSTSP